MEGWKLIKNFNNYGHLLLTQIYKVAIFNEFDHGWEPKYILIIKDIQPSKYY